jgi:hypothetical protein
VVLGWLFVAGLVIIWGIFLLPYGRFASAGSSVEEFERSMDVLAETHRSGSGRWVVMPRKGAAIKDFRGLSKARIRRRRRQILAGLAEATGLFLLMGVFPPLHAMLVPGLVLLGVLLLYLSLLARVKAAESERARVLAVARARAAETEPQPAPVPSAVATAPPVDELNRIADDVHVIVHRSDEVDLEDLRATAAAGAAG